MPLVALLLMKLPVLSSLDHVIPVSDEQLFHLIPVGDLWDK